MGKAVMCLMNPGLAMESVIQVSSVTILRNAGMTVEIAVQRPAKALATQMASPASMNHNQATTQCSTSGH
jgi:hypothetical protein